MSTILEQSEQVGLPSSIPVFDPATAEQIAEVSRLESSGKLWQHNLVCPLSLSWSAALRGVRGFGFSVRPQRRPQALVIYDRS